MPAVTCPNKKSSEEQGLNYLKDYLTKYPSYDAFANDLTQQLTSNNIDQEVKDLLLKHIRDEKNALNLDNFVGDVNNYASSMGADGISGSLKALAKARFPTDLFDFGNMQKINQYADEYAKLGLYLGFASAGKVIYDSPTPLDETGKQALKFGTSTLVSLGVSEALAAGGLFLLGMAAAPTIGLGAVVTGGAAILGAAAGVAVGNVMDQMWDKLIRNIDTSKTQGLSQEQAVQQALGDLMQEAKDLYDHNQVGKDDVYGPNSPFCVDNDPTPAPLPDWVTGAEGHFGAAATVVSPLVLDLDGDGIELAALNGTGSVYWDIDKDGFREASGWVTGGDGLLCVDKNSNGTIDDNGELFGNDATSANGFAALAAYDTNHDNKITSADSQFANLRVWIDADGDGYSQGNELHTLSSLGITSIDTTYSAVNYAIAGNSIKQEGAFVINGASRKIVDAWFAYDNVNSVYDGNYTLDLRAMFLPTQRGYGKLPDLHIAMSLNESLLQKVQVLATASATDIMDPAFNFAGKITDILYTWAGVENIDPASRGPYIDARTLGFLEVFMDKPFVWTVPEPDSLNPGMGAASELNVTWKAIFANIAGHLLAQSASVTELVDMRPGYDLVTDTLVGGELNVFVEMSGQFVIYGTDGRDIILGSNSSYQSSFGYGGDDTLIGGSNGSSLWGGEGNDTFYGGAGSDGLYGEAGNDTLTGGTGTDSLTGGMGDDTYVFRAGDSPTGSPDQVYEAIGEGTDTIKLTGGILPANVRMWAEYGALHIRYSSGDEVIVSGGTDSAGASDVGSRVERIVFDNGTVWNLASGLPLTDTDDGHYITGSALTDTIDGRGGNDYIYGFAGNDTLTGGTGTDYLTGGTGDDTFVFRVGDSLTGSPDSVYEANGEGVDTIKLTGGILPGAVTLSTSYGSLSIQYSPTDTIYVQSGYDSTTSETIPYAEKIVFDNGTVWDFRNGITTNGTSAADTIHGTGLKDIINGNGGDDSLYGEGGADTLNGGAGNDRLYGGYGDDKYVYTSGTGMDTIHDDGGAADVISLGAGYTASNITLTRVGQYDMAVLASGQQILLIEGQFTLPGSIETLKYGDGTSLNLLTYSHTLSGTAGNDTLYGTSYGAGGDRINGLDGNDNIYAGAGDDIVTGGNGNDYIYGEDGNDTLRGDAGDDTIYSGNGNDTVIYDSGADVFADYGGTDTISLTNAAFTAANMTLVRPAGNQGDLEVLLNGAHAFTIQGQFYQGYGFETITFANGSTFNLSTVQYTTNGTANGESLYGIGFGGNPDDIINGNGGDDYITALQGNDKITGGAGNDYIDGGDGNDTYFYNAGDGLDRIIDSSGTDTIQIGAGFVKSDLTWQRNGGTNDMNLILKGIQVMTITSQFLPGYQIETVKFADGSTQTLTGLQITTNGTDGNDSLSGLMYNASANDIINGKGGDDYIYGYNGNDTLTGGTGNDYLDGGDGNDTFVYNSGDGLDTITDAAGTDVIKIGAGFVKADLTWQRVNTCDLALYLKGVEVMIVKNHFQDGYAVESVKFSDNTTYALTNLALTINGTSASESLSGFNITNDNIKGNAGDDYLYGYGGNDTLTGGTGHDYLAGGTGNDTYVFKAGESPISNPDYVQENQNEGTDTIKLTGGILPANVIMWTDPYNLHIRYSATDEITVVSNYGPTGETLIGSYVEKITFDNGTVWSLTGGLILTDTDDTHSVIGSAFADTIDGRGGDDSLYAYGGDDTLIGGTGHDYLAGGTGNDTYVFKAGDSPIANPDYISEYQAEGTDTIRLTGGILPANVIMWTDYYNLHIRYSATDEITVTSSYDTTGSLIGSYVEKIAFDNGTVWSLTGGMALTDTDDSHSVIGSAQNDVIDGRGGDDSLYGYGGDDTLVGGTGHDYLAGGSGNDTYVFRAGESPISNPDYVTENLDEGTNTIKLTGGILPANVIMWTDYYNLHIRYSATDEITVTSSYDATGSLVGSYIEKIAFDNGMIWNLTGGLTLTDTDDAHSVIGSAFADTIDGRGGNDTLYTYGGDDTISGGGGNDYLYGGAGDDVYKWGSGSGADKVSEGSGLADKILVLPGLTPENLTYSVVNTYDLKITSAVNSADNITVQGEFNTGSPGYAVEKIEFSDGFSMNLSEYANWIKGTSSAETLNGDPGGVTRNDTILGGAGNDAINGLNGDDTISGDAGADTIHGNGGNDFLHGGSGNDVLYGDAGNDVLWGGLGADTLTGGTGADRFVFDASTASSDTIKDFSKTEDILDLSHLISGFDPVTKLITDFIQITDSGANSIVKVDVDGTENGVNFVQVATLQNVTGLTDEAALMASGHLLAA